MDETPWGQPASWRVGIPAPDQELLLKATLLPDERGLRAWRELRPRFDLDVIDAAALPLIPMLHRNLAVVDPATEILPRLRGIRRYLWAQNQLLLTDLMPVVGSLEAAGVRTALLKGGALIPLLEGPGLRPISDLDVLVPLTARSQAIDVLSAAGLVPLGTLTRGWIDSVLLPSSIASYAWRAASGHDLDLHWDAMHDSRQAGADGELWSAITEVEIAGVHTRVPDAADQLLHTVCHGMRWDQRPTYRWVADAWLLLAQPLDFGRLINQARRRRLTVPLHEGLVYLTRRLAAPVPPDVVRALERSRGSVLQRADHRVALRAPHERAAPARAMAAHQIELRRSVPTGARITPAAVIRAAVNVGRVRDGRDDVRRPLHFGESLDFGRSGNLSRFVVRGMAAPEADGCWTEGREARLDIPVGGPSGEARIVRISCHPFVHEAYPRQRLIILVNGRAVASWVGTGGTTISHDILIPESIMRGGDRLDLRLRTPDACSPRSIGAGDDRRELGWFVKEMTISTIQEYELGTALEFGPGAHAERYLSGCWWPGEAGGRWTGDGPASLIFRVDRSADAAVLELGAIALAGSVGRAVKVTVGVNGRRRGRLQFGAPTPAGDLRVGLGAVAAGQAIKLSLDVRAPVAPRELGLGEDPRRLGVRVHRLVVAEAVRPVRARSRGLGRRNAP